MERVDRGSAADVSGGGVYAVDDVVPVVDPTAFVHPSAVLIGDVRVGPGCYTGPSASLRGVVGAGSNIQDGCVLHVFPGRSVVVGPACLVGHRAVLHGRTLEEGAFVGIAATVMDGARVGARALVGAHSFVTEDTTVRAGRLITGYPAREVRELTADELVWTANGVRVYQELARRSLRTVRRVAPLRAVPDERARLSVDPSMSRPLNEHRVRGAGDEQS